MASQAHSAFRQKSSMFRLSWDSKSSAEKSREQLLVARAAPEWPMFGMPCHMSASMFTIAPPFCFIHCV